MLLHDRYIDIDPNAIAGTFDDLYDRKIERSVGESGIVTIIGGELQITFNNAISVRKFDDHHGIVIVSSLQFGDMEQSISKRSDSPIGYIQIYVIG